MDRTRQKRYYTPYESDDSEFETDSDDSYTSDSSADSRTITGPGSERPVDVVPAGIPRVIQEMLEESNTSYAKIIKSEPKTIDPSRNTSLIMISSRDRDTRIYPQPTFFTLRLPRTFKNIKSVTITQLNLLNSFFNFTTTKGNTNMYVRELGRTIPDSTGNLVPNDINIQIRNGTYSASELVSELNNAMNQTPLFADISGGLGAFIQDFQGTGDYSLLFNEPGPVVYNSLTGQYESNVTMSQLIARYFQTVQTVGTVNYSYNECVVAYYYPIIKEMTARGIPFNTHADQLPAGNEDPYYYILFGFQGLDDTYIQYLVQDTANITLFDEFRSQNTFLTFLVNQYVCAYNSLQGRLRISATSLNQSIQTDLQNQYATILNEQVVSAGFSNVADFQCRYNSLTQQNGALLEFYNFIHRNFTNEFGINFGQYTAEFFADKNNEVSVYNIVNHRGWNTTLTPVVSSNAISKSEFQPTQISTPLTNIIFPKVGTPGVSTFLSTINIGTVNFSNASETTFGYTDISFAILPTSYFRTEFSSRCRQTVNMMTLPRYTGERSAGTDEQYPYGPELNQTPLLFDIRNPPPSSTIYLRTDISGVIDFNMYDISQVMFEDVVYMRNEDRWVTFMKSQILSGVRLQETSPDYGAVPPIGDIVMVSYRPHIFFQLNMDGYNASPGAKWKVDIHIETQSSLPFDVPIVVAYYRDRAAFMADATNVIAKNYEDNPRNYFYRQTYSAVSSAVLTVDVLNNEQCYLSVHIAPGSAIPSAIPLRIFATLHDNYGVYTTATELDKRKMPWQNLPPIADQFTPNSGIYTFPLRSIYDETVTKIGYDISGVSNNLIDYYIQGTDNTYYDPTTITNYTTGTLNGLRYLFDLGTAVAAVPAPDSTAEWSLYFGAGSQNRILDTYNAGAANVYMSSFTQQKPLAYANNESVLVNWFNPNNTNSIRETYLNPASTLSLSTQNIFLYCVNPFNSLATDVSTSTAYQDSTGLHGMSFFLNPNDIVKLQNIQIKFTYLQPSVNNTGTKFTRTNSPLTNSNTNGFLYQNQATPTSVVSSSSSSWDDWYTTNRRNIRVGIFNSADISGANIQSLSINDAICTLTLKKVTQVGSYTNAFGTFRTREPDWGTYYTYEQIKSSDNIYSVSDNGAWTVANVTPDITPTFVAGNTSYPGYFLTHTNIFNYSYIPRSFGIATAVGHSVENPNLYVPSFMADIANSYTIVPFYKDPVDGQWKVGSFSAVSYTTTPTIPTTDITGDTAPYYGPPGIYGWDRGDTTNPVTASTIKLANGPNASFKPYYWNTKIDFEVLDAEYDPATDLSAFGGFSGISGELQDTYMFFYRNGTHDADLGDISTVKTESMPYIDCWKWGIEQNSNYYAWDDQNGYNYLSYINGLTVRPTNESTYNYAVHVRGYVPTSQFNTGLRLIGKNYTDFGTATLQEIAEEISDLNGYTLITNESAYNYTLDPAGYSTIIHNNDAIRLGTGNFYSHQYADALMRFNNLFKYPGGITFGKKIGYAGVTFPLAGYGNAIDTYTVYYSTLRGTLASYTSVLSTTTGKLNAYVRERYAGILPESVLTRTRVTDPIPFSMLFQSKLVSPYDTQFDEWGLGWNLGFKKADTSYLTTHVSDTFIRITQDYIYLRLNPEMNLNTMGVSGKEDLSLTRDTFAEDQKYFAKVLLNNFGGFCRAAVQMPKEFNPVLGKYDTISMQLVDRNGVQIVNDDCDYDIVLEISEVTDATRDKFAVPQGW